MEVDVRELMVVKLPPTPPTELKELQKWSKDMYEWANGLIKVYNNLSILFTTYVNRPEIITTLDGDLPEYTWILANARVDEYGNWKKINPDTNTLALRFNLNDDKIQLLRGSGSPITWAVIQEWS